jgi:hypothetical protein
MLMKDRHAAIVLLGLAACAADEPDMPPTGDRPRDCAAELAAWDRINGTPPDGTDVVLDSAMLRDPVSADPRPLADGNPDTSERLTVDERVILRLDDSVFVGALRYTPIAGAPAITDFRVYLSFDRECWGDPVASGAFDGSDAAQEVLMNGRAANYIRIDILGATDGAAEVGVTDFAIVT